LIHSKILRPKGILPGCADPRESTNFPAFQTFSSPLANQFQFDHNTFWTFLCKKEVCKKRTTFNRCLTMTNWRQECRVSPIDQWLICFWKTGRKFCWSGQLIMTGLDCFEGFDPKTPFNFWWLEIRAHRCDNVLKLFSLINYLFLLFQVDPQVLLEMLWKINKILQ
jgi:hypothetical protein